MKSYENTFIKLFGLFCISTLAVLFLTLSFAIAGAPEIRETCHDKQNRPIRNIYDSNLRVFAEARMVPRSEQEFVTERGLSPFVIHINPERYYLGQNTQRWLYHRQCVLISKNPMAVREGRRLSIDEEQQLDCLAIQTMQSGSDAGISNRLIESIERDIERLLRNNRWGEVLSGPERLVNLKKCYWGQ